MFKFIKKCFFTAMTIFGCSILGVDSLKCVSRSNQNCKIRSEIINVSSNEPTFYPYSIKINKCSGHFNSISDLFNLISRTNETRHIEYHEICKGKCRLDASVCNNRQRWNEDKCRCECKELINKGICDQEFIWNPRNCECGCDKSCDIREYLGYKNFKCRYKIVDKLVEECSENIDENEMIYNETLNAILLNASIPLNTKAWNSCTMYIVLFVIFLK